MGRYKLVVLTKAVAGQDKEFNDWYSNIHLADVLAVEGFTSAVRLSYHSTIRGDPSAPSPYLAIYDIEADAPEDVMARLSETISAGRMRVSETLDMESVNAWLYTEI